ncbi:MAG: acyl-[acyl-carrier-protein] thioesterase [Monoglobaceae bacterium]
MFYNETYTPRVSDLDRNGKLSYESLLQLLETVGGHHSDLADDSVISGSRRGIAWILTNWRISLLRHTDGTEKLNITTWVHGKAETPTVFRSFILTDENGAEVMRAEAKFCLLDMSSGRLTRISKELLAAYSPEEKTAFDRTSPRLRAPDSYTTEQAISMRRSDIDFNLHVHNTRYIAFALEALPQDVYVKDDFSEVQIVYSKPVNEQDMVTAKYVRTESGHFVGIYANDVLCTMIELKDR